MREANIAAIVAVLALLTTLATAGMICTPSPDAPAPAPIAAPIPAPVSVPTTPPSSPTPSPTVITGIKFTPGHYFMIYKSNKYNPSYWKGVSGDLESTTALKGIEVKFNWRELEPTQGKYNFTGIDFLLNKLKPTSKKLILLFELKTFNLGPAHVPDYILQNAIYDGGVQAYTQFGSTTKFGDVIKIWNANVMNRFEALLAAMGSKYDQNILFEGLGYSESTFQCLGTNCPTDEIFSQKLMALNAKTRAKFPHSLVYQFVNYPPSILAYQATQLKSTGSGWAGPDVFPTDSGLTAPGRAYSYYANLSGIVPLLPSVQSEDYTWTSHLGPGHKPTINELLIFARDNLLANYIVWERAIMDGHSYFAEVLAMLKLPAQANAPAGGLKTACPSTYLSRGGCHSG